MKIEYASHYDDLYWKGKKTYRDGNGNEQHYHGPGLAWDGFDLVADALKRLLPGKNLLDIGCGGGDLAHRMLKRGYDAYGIDISTYAIEHCHTDMRGRLLISNITTCPDLLGIPTKFDVVMATDLLEHIYMEDLDTTFDWMVSKANRWLFFLIAIVDGAVGKEGEFVAKRGEPIPLQFEATAISGHVNVRTWQFWVKYFKEKGLTIRWDLQYIFQMYRERNPAWQATGGWNHGSTWILEKTV